MGAVAAVTDIERKALAGRYDLRLGNACQGVRDISIACTAKNLVLDRAISDNGF